MAPESQRDNRHKPILLVALGGNALIRKGQQGTIEEQFENLRVPISQIARLTRDYRIIITHGNGPQVGNLLLQQECCDDVPKMPGEEGIAFLAAVGAGPFCEWGEGEAVVLRIYDIRSGFCRGGLLDGSPEVVFWT